MRSSRSSLSDIALPSRYELLFRLASGGTASVHVGMQRSIAGFRRLVAVKVAHAHLGASPAHRWAMVEEARLAAQIHHPNVIPVIDIDDADGRLLLIMDYIEGASLAELRDSGAAPMPAKIAVRVALDACAGLHAAHQLTDAFGNPLGLVHRDVSPHNVIVGADGVARLTDFGIAKTTFMHGTSGVGTLKGKLAYMAPEYISGCPADARSDVFGLAVVVWEMLADRRLFPGENGHETLCNVLYTEAPLLSSIVPSLGDALDQVLARALTKNPEERFRTAGEFAAALEAAARRADLIATASEVGAFVVDSMGDGLVERRRRLAEAFDFDFQVDSQSPSSPEPPQNSEPHREEPTLPREIIEAPATQRSPVRLADDSPTLPSKDMAAAIKASVSEPAPAAPASQATATASQPAAPASQPVAAQSQALPPVAQEKAPIAKPRRHNRAFAATAITAFVLGALARLMLPMSASQDELPSSAPPAAAPSVRLTPAQLAACPSLARPMPAAHSPAMAFGLRAAK